MPTYPDFYLGSRGLNLGFCAYTAGTLPIESTFCVCLCGCVHIYLYTGVLFLYPILFFITWSLTEPEAQCFS